MCYNICVFIFMYNFNVFYEMTTSVDSIVDVNKLAEWIQIKTDVGKTCLKKQLEDWSTDTFRLQALSTRFRRFKESFAKDSNFFPTCSHIFNEIAEIEKKLNKLLKTDSTLEKESYNEILFFRPILQSLNFIPFLLSIWSFIRVYLLPGLSFLVPFLTLLAPYIILKFAFNLPITFNNYMNILHSMVSGNFGKIMDPNSAMTDSSISPVAFIKQFGIVMITFVQGIIQQYWS